MLWICVDKDGKEYIYSSEPIRDGDSFITYVSGDSFRELPKGSIEKLIGRKLTWDDEPVRIE